MALVSKQHSVVFNQPPHLSLAGIKANQVTCYRKRVVSVAATKILWIPSIITWIDIAISIAGWAAVMHVEHPLAPTPYSQTSIALLTVIYLYLVGVFAVFWHRRNVYFKEERWALKGVTICIPLLAIRLAYSLIVTITGNMDFNAIKGNSTAYLVMTMLPEVAIIGVCTCVIGVKIIPLRQRGKQISQRVEYQESQHGISME